MSSPQRHKRKALFIVTSFWAHGELQLAIDFSKKFQNEFESIFLVPKLHTEIVSKLGIPYFNLVANSPILNRIMFESLESRFKPDLVVLADFLNYRFCHRHYGVTEGDLSVFSGKLCAFDIYDYGRSSKIVDAYGYVATHMSGLKIDRYELLIQPVPIALPSISEEKKVFRYGLLTSKKNNVFLPEKFGKRKKILVVSSGWQFAGGHPQETHAIVGFLIKGLVRFIENYSSIFDFVVLGYDFTKGHSLRGECQYFSALSPDEFSSLIETIDCVIGFNSISTSLAKIALKGVPVINITNRYLRKNSIVWDVVDKKECISERFPDEDFYPFKLFPVGWHNFLSHLDNNDYYSLIHDVQVFEMEEIASEVAQVIEGRDKHCQKVMSYLEKLSILDSHYDADYLFR